MVATGSLIETTHGRWVLAEQIGGGGQATVWTAFPYQEGPGQPPFRKPTCAVKFLLSTDKQALARFAQEVEALRLINDPRIIKIRGYTTQGNRGTDFKPFLVMDFVEGSTLSKLVTERKAYIGKLTEALTLMKEIALGVGVAHKKGVIHRDLKPENIIVDSDGMPVILDFGICHFIGGKRHTLAGEKVGAFFYIPPELAAGPADEKEICPANDIYSLGKILYFTIAGEIFDRERHKEQRWDLRRRLSPQLNYLYEVFDRSISEQPAARCQSIEEFADVIDKARILIEEHFYPAEEGRKCIVCGEGTYQPVRGRVKKELWEIKSYAGDPNLFANCRLFVCSECGNMQHFCPSRVILDPRSKDEG